MSTPALLERSILRWHAGPQAATTVSTNTWQRLATKADCEGVVQEPFGRCSSSAPCSDEIESSHTQDVRAVGPFAGLEPGTEPVAGYRLAVRIGSGGSGEVWRAHGPGDFPVAMKFIPREDTDVAIELGPADADEFASLDLMRDVRHAHLLAFFGAWQCGGLLALGMELADRTLLDRCEEAMNQGLRGIPFAELIEYLVQAAMGIDYLNEPRHVLRGHSRTAIQHCDIKPQNLLLVGDSVKLGDFGLATLLKSDRTPARDGMTPAYAAPEVFSGHLSSRSDQYSLAVSYCRLRGGRLPFTGSPWEVILKHCLDFPDLTMLPEAERPVVARAMAKEPDDRWPDCRTFVWALQESNAHPKRSEVVPSIPLAAPCPWSALPGDGPCVDEVFADDTAVGWLS
jgi:serine/threonine protein kinase